jgi:hypothetical protein
MPSHQVGKKFMLLYNVPELLTSSATESAGDFLVLKKLANVTGDLFKK